jgi:hypothetical protein
MMHFDCVIATHMSLLFVLLLLTLCCVDALLMTTYAKVKTCLNLSKAYVVPVEPRQSPYRIGVAGEHQSPSRVDVNYLRHSPSRVDGTFSRTPPESLHGWRCRRASEPFQG